MFPYVEAGPKCRGERRIAAREREVFTAVAGNVAGVSYEEITACNSAHSVVPWISAAPSKATKPRAAGGQFLPVTVPK
jgi:hypothetical protein